MCLKIQRLKTIIFSILKLVLKKDNKDFLQILEGQKDNIKKASKETNIFDRKVEKKMWKIVEKEQPKAIEDNLEKKQKN